MVISSIHGATSSGDISPLSNHRNTRHKVAQSRNRNTGPDTVAFSQEALAKAQRLSDRTTASGNEESPLTDEMAPEADALESKPQGGTSRLPKKSLFSMLLENLFLAELEKNPANAGTANSENTTPENDQSGTSAQPRQQPQTTKAGNALGDDGKVAAIKKFLTDFAKGKADLSDLPKAMAAGNASGGMGNMRRAASNNQPSASSPTGKNEEIHQPSV